MMVPGASQIYSLTNHHFSMCYAASSASCHYDDDDDKDDDNNDKMISMACAI